MNKEKINNKIKELLDKYDCDWIQSKKEALINYDNLSEDDKRNLKQKLINKLEKI